MGQFQQSSPGSQVQLPQPGQEPQSLGQVPQDSSPSQVPSPHQAGQAPQSRGQV